MSGRGHCAKCFNNFTGCGNKDCRCHPVFAPRSVINSALTQAEAYAIDFARGERDPNEMDLGSFGKWRKK